MLFCFFQFLFGADGPADGKGVEELGAEAEGHGAGIANVKGDEVGTGEEIQHQILDGKKLDTASLFAVLEKV